MAPSVSIDAGMRRLMLLTGILLISYLCVALPLAIIPIQVTHTLDLAPGWAGVAVGIAFLSTILTRGHAGAVTDRSGPRIALLRGLLLYALGGLMSCAAAFPLPAGTALAVLVAGRLALGLGESLVGVGVISWAIAEAGPQRAGRVIAILGTAIYAALGAGGPVGMWLFDKIGFGGTMAVATLLPLIGFCVAFKLRGPEPISNKSQAPFLAVVRKIWIHGLVITAQGVGFAAIGAFFVLHMMDMGWSNAGLGLAAFGAGFVLVRVLGMGLVDKFGGLSVAVVALSVETVGQSLICVATVPELALGGALLTGCGCSLVFPAIGREVVRLVPAEQRGAAVGGFSDFQDLAYGITGPLAGLLASYAGTSSPFGVGAVVGAAGFALAVRLWTKGRECGRPSSVPHA